MRTAVARIFAFQNSRIGAPSVRTANRVLMSTVSVIGTQLECAGCGHIEDGLANILFKCPNSESSPECDHVLAPKTPGKDCTATLQNGCTFPAEEINEIPFLRYRALLYPYRIAIAKGMSDEVYVNIIQDLNNELVAVGGTGFTETPLLWNNELNSFVKNETLNVAQSHKARHLFNLMSYLLVMSYGEQGVGGGLRNRRLAVASCGNAGLAAATVAAAAKWPIDVCIPPDAEPAVVEQLHHLGASVHICRRDADFVETSLGKISSKGEADPTLAVFKNLVKDHGSIPFSVQGSECGLGVEGSQTIAWEVLEAMQRDFHDSKSPVENSTIENVFIQVGGGALGSGMIQGFQRALDGELEQVNPTLGSNVIRSLPKLFCIQPVGCGPLKRALDEMKKNDITNGKTAAKDRATYMYPWENPHSIAHGILDDETYDWLSLVDGMISTEGGGFACGR
eukprot:g3152.t1